MGVTVKTGAILVTAVAALAGTWILAGDSPKDAPKPTHISNPKQYPTLDKGKSYDIKGNYLHRVDDWYVMKKGTKPGHCFAFRAKKDLRGVLVEGKSAKIIGTFSGFREFQNLFGVSHDIPCFEDAEVVPREKKDQPYFAPVRVGYEIDGKFVSEEEFQRRKGLIETKRFPVHAKMRELLLTRIFLKTDVCATGNGTWCYENPRVSKGYDVVEGIDLEGIKNLQGLDRCQRLLGFDQFLFSDATVDALFDALAKKQDGDKIALKWSTVSGDLKTTEFTLREVCPACLLGIDADAEQIDARSRLAQNIPDGKVGARLKVAEPTRFSEAGLQDFDLLVSVEGQFLVHGHLGELASIFKRMGQGKQSLKVTYLRDGELKTAQIQLAGGPPSAKAPTAPQPGKGTKDPDDEPEDSEGDEGPE